MAIPGLEVTERPWAGNSDARVFARDPGPGNPNVPPGGSVEARSLRNSPAVAAPPSVAPNRLRAAFDSVTGRNFVGPQQPMSTAARVGAGLGVAAGVASEAPDVMAVVRDPGSSGLDVATQVAGAGGKLAAAGLGAKAGAALGAFGGPAAPLTIPLGAALGGAAGYFGADKLIEGGRSLAGVDTRDPAEQVKAAAPSVPSATPSISTPAAPNPTDQRLAGGVQTPAAGGPGAPSLRNDITRVGNEYSGGPSITGPITINGQQPGSGTVSPQNMAAANNLAATDSLRSQGAVLSGQPASPSVPAVAPTPNSSNSWEARNNLRNLAVSASSIYDRTSQWGDKGKAAADTQAFQNAQAMDTAARTGSDQGSVSRTNAAASMTNAKTAADASKENSRNSLRGTMYTADSQLGARQLEMQQKLRQQQMLGGIYQAAGGDPVKAAKLAATYGIDGKSFQDMAAADQARAQGNVKDARSTFENMFTREGKNGPERDENAEAMANQLADQIAPGYSRMSVEERAAVRPKIIDATRMVQNMNTLRNTGWLQKVGVDAPTPAYSQLPDLGGSTVSDVGFWEGLTTPDVRSGDKKISLRDGGVRYLPQGSLTESQLRLLQNNGAVRQ